MNRSFGRMVSRMAPLLFSLLASACTEDSSDVRKDAGQDAGNDARVGDSADAASDAVAARVPPGTCGVVQRIEIPDAFSKDWRFFRIGGTFRGGPWRSNALGSLYDSVIVDDSGVHAISLSMEVLHIRAVIPIGPSSAAGKTILIETGDVPGFDEPITTWLAQAGVPAIGGEVIGELFIRGTTAADVASSFDGNRALFVSGHVVTQDPRLFLLDAAGKKVGPIHELATAGESLTFNCLAATPTRDGAAASMITGETSLLWRLMVLASDGTVSLRTESAWPGTSQTAAICPVVRATKEGFRVLARAEPGVRVLDVGPDGVTELVRSEHLGGAFWAGDPRNGTVAILNADSGGVRISTIDASGRVSHVPGDLPGGEVIPSEPGRLFLDVKTREPTEKREIVEITCKHEGVSLGAPESEGFAR